MSKTTGKSKTFMLKVYCWIYYGDTSRNISIFQVLCGELSENVVKCKSKNKL